MSVQSPKKVCFENNPKSYGAWHHRGWVLERMQNADLKREMKFCNSALKLDERNFHCWDHRRLVCRLCEISPEEEAKFSDEKIAENFSNYSAWHYRSSLLPKIFPDTEGVLNLQAEKLKSELELITNAFYTDPEDQSCWFYCTWLFDQEKRDETGLNLISYKPLESEDKSVVFLFDRAVNLRGEAKILSNNEAVQGRWLVTDGSKSSFVWVFEFQTAQNFEDSSVAYELQVPNLGLKPQGLNFATGVFVDETRLVNQIQSSIPPKTIEEAMEKQLSSCQELAEIESENKWPLLVATWCKMRLFDGDAKRKAEILENFKKLETLDSKRTNFYRDMASKFSVGQKFLNWLTEKNWDAKFDLEGLSLTTIPFGFFMVTTVTELDIQNNRLASLKPLACCIGLKKLNADNNLLTSLNGLESCRLEFLSVKNNDIDLAENVEFLKEMTSLKCLKLGGNPVVSGSNSLVKSWFPNELLQ